MYILKAIQETGEYRELIRASKVCFWHNMEPHRKMLECVFIEREGERERKTKMKHKKC